MTSTNPQTFADRLTELVNEEINRVTTGAVPIGEILQQLLEVHKRTERVQQRAFVSMQSFQKEMNAKLATLEGQLTAKLEEVQSYVISEMILTSTNYEQGTKSSFSAHSGKSDTYSVEGETS